MLSNLYLLAGFSNYANRELKYYSDLDDYLGYDAISFSDINFNPNDEVTTQQILNVRDSATFDYLVVQSQETGEIVSRWFVIDKVRVREGQWKLTLRRDVVADNWFAVKAAPCFIEKATLGYNDPRIFNKENMTYNQIKTSETLIRDLSQCPWIVGYYSKTREEEGAEQAVNIAGSFTTNNLEKLPVYEIDTTIEDWYDGMVYNASNFNNFEEPVVYESKNWFWRFYVKAPYIDDPDFLYTSRVFEINIDHRFIFKNNKVLTDGSLANRLTFKNTSKYTPTLSKAEERFLSALRQGSNKNNLNRLANEILANPEADEMITFLKSINGLNIRTSDNKVYTFKISKVVTEPEFYVGNSYPNSNINTFLNNCASGGYFTGSYNSETYKLYTELQYYSFSLEERSDLALYYAINHDEALRTEDAPYNIFAIPYGEVDVYDNYNQEGEQTICRTNADIAMQVAMDIQTKFPGIVYDIQILPYCPVQNLLGESGKEIYLTSDAQYSKIYYEYGEQRREMVGLIVNVPYGKFSFDIPTEVFDLTLNAAVDAENQKINSECDMWRLTAPNYSASFDFSVEKNGGVERFNVDCEYKPFTPYIHVNPNFKNFYGQDYNDPRGLVCGGDFSIAAVVDQWEQYQIQNKNFQNIFDRQIQNIDINNAIQKQLDIAGAIAGTLQGAAGGALTGSMFNKGVAGGIVGGLGSAITGAIDVGLSEKLRAESKSFAVDNYGYQLGNIQALPNTLTRVSAFNNNNKLFPVLEYYTCTDIEKEALKNKIKYDGMTVMTIGVIQDFTRPEETFIKGKIIKIPLISEDAHVVDTIKEEISNGLYIQGGL